MTKVMDKPPEPKVRAPVFDPTLGEKKAVMPFSYPTEYAARQEIANFGSNPFHTLGNTINQINNCIPLDRCPLQVRPEPSQTWVKVIPEYKEVQSMMPLP
jgi:hypothetical protein